MSQLEGATDAQIYLGPGASWLGPAIFALAALIYALATWFEARVDGGLPTLATLFKASAEKAELSTEVYAAIVTWRASALLLIGAGLVAILATGRSMWVGARRAWREVAVLAVLVALTMVIWKMVAPPSVLEQLGFLLADSNDEYLKQVGKMPYQMKSWAEIIGGLVGVGGAALIVLPATLDVKNLARRVQTLRLLTLRERRPVHGVDRSDLRGLFVDDPCHPHRRREQHRIDRRLYLSRWYLPFGIDVYADAGLSFFARWLGVGSCRPPTCRRSWRWLRERRPKRLARASRPFDHSGRGNSPGPAPCSLRSLLPRSRRSYFLLSQAKEFSCLQTVLPGLAAAARAPRAAGGSLANQ